MSEMQEMEEIRRAASQSPEYAAQLARLLSEGAAGMYLAGAFRHSAMQALGHEPCSIYFEELAKGIYPGLRADDLDPILRMRVEQTALLHHQIGVLLTEGTSKQPTEVRKTVLGLAAQLLGEFRRLSSLVRNDLASLLAEHQSNGSSRVKVQVPKEQDSHARGVA